jgi:hypothetical protein
VAVVDEDLIDALDGHLAAAGLMRLRENQTNRYLDQECLCCRISALQPSRQDEDGHGCLDNVMLC